MEILEQNQHLTTLKKRILKIFDEILWQNSKHGLDILDRKLIFTNLNKSFNYPLSVSVKFVKKEYF